MQDSLHEVAGVKTSPFAEYQHLAAFDESSVACEDSLDAVDQQRKTEYHLLYRLQQRLEAAPEPYELPHIELASFRRHATLIQAVRATLHSIITRITKGAVVEEQTAFQRLRTDFEQISAYHLQFAAEREVTRVAGRWPALAACSKPLRYENPFQDFQTRCDALVPEFNGHEVLMADGLMRLAANVPQTALNAIVDATDIAFEYALAKIAYVEEKGLRAQIIRIFLQHLPPDPNGRLLEKLIDHFSLLELPYSSRTAYRYEDFSLQRNAKNMPYHYVHLFREFTNRISASGGAIAHRKLRALLPLGGAEDAFVGELVAGLAACLPAADARAAHAELREITEHAFHEECRSTAIVALAAHLPPGSEASSCAQLRKIAWGIRHYGYARAAQAAVADAESRAGEALLAAAHGLLDMPNANVFLRLHSEADKLVDPQRQTEIMITLETAESRVADHVITCAQDREALRTDKGYAVFTMIAALRIKHTKLQTILGLVDLAPRLGRVESMFMLNSLSNLVVKIFSNEERAMPDAAIAATRKHLAHPHSIRTPAPGYGRSYRNALTG